MIFTATSSAHPKILHCFAYFSELTTTKLIRSKYAVWSLDRWFISSNFALALFKRCVFRSSYLYVSLDVLDGIGFALKCVYPIYVCAREWFVVVLFSLFVSVMEMRSLQSYKNTNHNLVDELTNEWCSNPLLLFDPASLLIHTWDLRPWLLLDYVLSKLSTLPCVKVVSYLAAAAAAAARVCERHIQTWATKLSKFTLPMMKFAIT